MKLNLVDVFGNRKGLSKTITELTELEIQYVMVTGERLKFDPLKHRTKQAYMKAMEDRIEVYGNSGGVA